MVETPEWKRETVEKNMSFGKATKLTLQEQRESLPIFKLRGELLQSIAENQVLVVIGETVLGDHTTPTPVGAPPHPRASPLNLRRAVVRRRR